MVAHYTVVVARGRIRDPSLDTITTAVRLAPRFTSRRRWVAVVMSRKQSAPRYAGPLARPIYQPLAVGMFDPSYFGGKPPKEEAWDRAWEQVAEKLPLLFKHYGVDPKTEECWLHLGLNLALAHVPGLQIHFKFPPKRRRKKTWQAGLGNDLLSAVEGVTSKTGKRIRAAIQKLRKDQPDTWGRFTTQSLCVRYREAKRKQKENRSRMADLLAQLPPGMGGILGMGPTSNRPNGMNSIGRLAAFFWRRKIGRSKIRRDEIAGADFFRRCGSAISPLCLRGCRHGRRTLPVFMAR